MNLLKQTSLAAVLGLFAFSTFAAPTNAETNPFANQGLVTFVADADAKGKCGEGKCGEGKMKKAKGKCGEGKCGEGKMKKAKGKCGEGKCGEGKMKKAKGKCGEGKAKSKKCGG